MATHIQNTLQEYYTHNLPDNAFVCIDNVHRISDGWETDIYAFDLESGRSGEPTRDQLILRIYPGKGGGVESAREFRGMGLLYESGYPVPKVHMQAGEDSTLGYPFVIMDRINGQVMWQMMNSASDKVKADLLTLFCDLFVNLHNLDWRPFSKSFERTDNRDPYEFVDYWINTARLGIQQYKLPGFSDALDWFTERRADIPCSRPSVVHLDFHPNNVLLRADGQAFVIDWSQISLSDPRFDLAWTLVLVFAYMGDHWRDKILAGYEGILGEKIDRIEVFEAYACTRRLFYVTASLTHGAETFGMRPNAVESMRKQMGPLSNVYNRLQAITGIKVPEVDRLLE
jgi:aminoglycoside phosphotransferase (APT) family kinase protein